MNKEQLKFHIEECRKIEDKYGISPPDVYYSLNYLIHKLLESIFGYENTEILEDYIYGTSDLSFDQLCTVLKIEN